MPKLTAKVSVSAMPGLMFFIGRAVLVALVHRAFRSNAALERPITTPANFPKEIPFPERSRRAGFPLQSLPGIEEDGAARM